jgi:hypothetical protein
MDIQKLVLTLRDALDDLAAGMEHEAGANVEAVVSITANGAGLTRTRAFLDGAKVLFNGSGEGRMLTSTGQHRLTWDIQGPANADLRIVVAVDGIHMADEAGNLGPDGKDGGAVTFTIE